MGSDLTIDALVGRYDLDAESAERLGVLLERLAGDERAPTSVRELLAVLERHIADSLVALDLAQVRSAGRVADLGSGAGLPGLALATALPAARFALVESQRAKCAYIASLTAALRLTNVRVACVRVEGWPDGRERHDLVLARALAPQPVVVEYAAPLLELGGVLVDWRGRRDPDEEARADRASEELGMRRLEVREVTPFAAARDRHLHVFEKLSPTPPRFPRREGLARRKPLGG
ncbi:MAG: 16S rRNA (guanine(527)-N(7))-methyltransferase RsmG [Solirubrobacteraceae bacterium]